MDQKLTSTKKRSSTTTSPTITSTSSFATTKQNNTRSENIPNLSINEQLNPSIRQRSTSHTHRKKPGSSLDKEKDHNNTNNDTNKQDLNEPSQQGITLWKMLLSELNIFNLINQNNSDESINNSFNSSSNENVLIQSELLLNFIKIPIFLEEFMFFGLLNCFNLFIKMLIIIPLRFLIHTFYNLLNFKKINKKNLEFKKDFITILLFSIVLFFLKDLDTSKIYHNIRTGTVIKLYFMVGVLEVFDKLLGAVGQDIMMIVYRKLIGSNNLTTTVITTNKFKEKFIDNGVILIITIGYLYLHSYVFVYQIMALNVAINSYSNSLLTLILSNQFSELKSSVFKKIEREGLFQISCSDLNERFQLILMLFIISSRNLFQVYNVCQSNDKLKPDSWWNFISLSPSSLSSLSSSSTSSSSISLSNSFTNNWIGILFGPAFIVIGSEILVDWLKHSYIAKFNRIRPSVYLKYSKILSIDYVNSFKTNLKDSSSISPVITPIPNNDFKKDHINNNNKLTTTDTDITITSIKADIVNENDVELNKIRSKFIDGESTDKGYEFEKQEQNYEYEKEKDKGSVRDRERDREREREREREKEREKDIKSPVIPQPQDISSICDEEYSEVILLKRTGLPLYTNIIVFLKMVVYPWIKYLLIEDSEEIDDNEITIKNTIINSNNLLKLPFFSNIESFLLKNFKSIKLFKENKELINKYYGNFKKIVVYLINFINNKYFGIENGEIYYNFNFNFYINYIGLITIIGCILFILFLRLISSLILLKWSNKIIKRNIKKVSSSGSGGGNGSSTAATDAISTKRNGGANDDYVPGNPNVTLSELNGPMRKNLYNDDEKVPPSLEELRIKKTKKIGDDKLEKVIRYDMADKLIW
ncbi:hypothetical protein B5S31_g4769 [[Candida] boidinii]|nr:hypothetical protein B5S31_g4769 [[Candida] boidinii]